MLSLYLVSEFLQEERLCEYLLILFACTMHTFFMSRLHLTKFCIIQLKKKSTFSHHFEALFLYQLCTKRWKS